MVNVASMGGKLGQVSKEHQKALSSDSCTVETVTQLMETFVETTQSGKHREAGFSNSAYGMSKLGVIAAGRVHARQLAHRNVSSCGCVGL